jgi:hypothetical protein
MFEHVTANMVSNEVRMIRAATPKSVLIIEGTNDKAIYKKMVDLEITEIVVAFNKQNTIESIILLNECADVCNYLGIVDSDFFGINSYPEVPNLFFTDFHDIEISIFKSTAFDEITSEFCTQKLDSFKMPDEKLEVTLFKKIHAYSILKYINDRDYNFLSFDNIDVAKFISPKDLSIDISKCIKVVVSNTIARLDSLISTAATVDQRQKYIEIKTNYLEKIRFCKLLRIIRKRLQTLTN